MKIDQPDPISFTGQTVTINATGSTLLIIRADGVRTNRDGVPLHELSREALLDVITKLTDLFLQR